MTNLVQKIGGYSFLAGLVLSFLAGVGQCTMRSKALDYFRRGEFTKAEQTADISDYAGTAGLILGGVTALGFLTYAGSTVYEVMKEPKDREQNKK